MYFIHETIVQLPDVTILSLKPSAGPGLPQFYWKSDKISGTIGPFHTAFEASRNYDAYCQSLLPKILPLNVIEVDFLSKRRK